MNYSREIVYKENIVSIIDVYDRQHLRVIKFTIRLHNKFGFRWFTAKKDLILNVKKAVEIENEIQEKPFGKYAFVCPIELN